MKWKIATIILAASLVIVSCESDTVDASMTEEPFEMSCIDKSYGGWDEDFYLYVDEETDVEYIVMSKEGAYAITPRYKRDGTVYTKRQ